MPKKKFSKKSTRKKTNEELFDILSNNIHKYNDELWIPPIKPEFKLVNKNTNKTNKTKVETWFKINRYEHQNDDFKNIPLNIEENNDEQLYKTIKIRLLLNNKQKNIINNWLNAYIIMYNITLKHIKRAQAKLKNNKNIDEVTIIKDFKIKIKKDKKICTLLKKNIKKTSTKNKKKSSSKKIINDDKTETRTIKIPETTIKYQELRTYFLIKHKNKIIKESGLNKKSKIPSHILDGAIKRVCANYQTCLTNLQRGYIKKFRLRYWKFNRNYKTMDIEKCYITEDTICPSTLGNMKFRYNAKKYKYLKNVKYKHNNETCTIGTNIVESLIIYDSIKNKYYLHAVIKIDEQDINKPKKIISIDPGVRNFMTGISENEVVVIRNDVQDKIKKILLEIDDLNNKNNKVKHRKIKIIRKHTRLKNLVTELHWKTINYLTNRYETILIGNLSAKSISSCENSNIRKMTKRLAYTMSFYKFRERLKYKCSVRGNKYREVNEYCTTKACSVCTNINKDLGSSKIYECLKCKIIMDRDVNGSRNMYFASIK
jgi:IS605 OrfB family transposase